MDRATALEIFNKSLDALSNSNLSIPLHIEWFVDDFNNFTRDYIDEIFKRIENPQLNNYQPMHPLIVLIGRLMTNPNLDRSLILDINKLPKAINSLIAQKDVQSSELLKQLIWLWNSYKYISPELNEAICKEYEAEVQWQPPDEIVVEEEEEAEEPNEPEETPDTDNYRPWMLPANIWETGKGQEKLLPEDHKPRKQGKSKKIYYRVTKNNDNAKCSQCKCPLKKIDHPKYGLVYTDAKLIKGSGFVHLSCLLSIDSFLL